MQKDGEALDLPSVPRRGGPWPGGRVRFHRARRHGRYQIALPAGASGLDAPLCGADATGLVLNQSVNRISAFPDEEVASELPFDFEVRLRHSLQSFAFAEVNRLSALRRYPQDYVQGVP